MPLRDYEDEVREPVAASARRTRQPRKRGFLFFSLILLIGAALAGWWFLNPASTIGK